MGRLAGLHQERDRVLNHVGVTHQGGIRRNYHCPGNFLGFMETPESQIKV